MARDEKFCYVYIQLPGTVETVPCASLRVRSVGAGVHEGTLTYGRRYLERSAVVALDPFHLPLSTRPMRFTKRKGIPGALRDASPDAWGRRVIQVKLQRPEADIQEIEYLLNGPDDGAGAMVTNNDDHPRNHALLRTTAGWRLSPAYDILPVSMVSVERRDLALEAGRFGRAASLYNLLSNCDAFGLGLDEARLLIDAMLAVVRGWREFFAERGVDTKSIEMLEQAMLPVCFFLQAPPEAV